MIRKLSSSFRSRIAVPGLLFGFTLAASVSVSGQNLLQNGNFEQRLGPTNWTVGYLHGGAADWEIKNRIRAASMYAQGSATKFYGGCFRWLSYKPAHAYFTQTVTNLTPGHVYQVSGNMYQDWWKTDDPLRHLMKIYIEAIGGQGTLMEDGRFSMLATNDFTDSGGNVNTNIDAPYTYPNKVWRPFYTPQIPDADGNIEIRLHYNHCNYDIYDKSWTSAAYFDDISLTP